MKYLLGFLEGVSDGPDLADPGFQQLLVDVQAGKTHVKAADAFYESLEKIVNELKSTTESTAFQKPVSKREAPGYYEIIKRPMDLSTVLRNIKAHKYKNKTEFAFDLDLIWDNCIHYNTQPNHPLRASARFMKQKADHHLEFLVNKNDRTANPLLPLLPTAHDNRPSSLSALATLPARPSPLRSASQLLNGGEEDAAGESDDGAGDADGDQSLRTEGESSALPKVKVEGQAIRKGSPMASLIRSVSRARRGTSVASAPADGRVNGIKPNGLLKSPPPSRPKLPTSLDSAPPLVRSPYSMTHFLSIALNQPGPSFSDKGKAKEILRATPPPAWYPASVTSDDEDVKLEGSWWSFIGKDETYTAGLPSVPMMAQVTPPRKRRMPGRKIRRSSVPNRDSGIHKTPPLVLPGPVSMEKVVYRSVDKLCEARRVVGQIQEFQRIETEGGILPTPNQDEEEERKEREKKERISRKRRRKAELVEATKRRRTGGEIGEAEAVMGVKKTTASILAHAGFEGANEIALDMFTRVAVDHLHNLGRTLRSLVDGFSHKMTSEEIVLHALHENGQIQPSDLEAHIKDDIEREGGKISEMTRKIRQAYKEVTTAPVIEDDMMFADGGQMLLDGNFADELGEDFLGLRDLGIDKEHSLASLTVPSSVFYGRRKRVADAAQLGAKVEKPDYRPPPPFIPLNPATLFTHLPALLHAFYATRIDSGLSITEDDAFDPSHSQIGSLGQIVVRNQSGMGTKKTKAVKGDEKGEKKKSGLKKILQPGIGKGNWGERADSLVDHANGLTVRPSKEERDRRAAQKKAASSQNGTNGGRHTPISEDAMGEDEDAEGEEEEEIREKCRD